MPDPHGLCLSQPRCTVSIILSSTFDLTNAVIPDADIVCSRAKNHYDPQGSFDFSDSATQADDATTTLENFKRGFKPLHQKMATVMYFS